jgi:hypothetical protein
MTAHVAPSRLALAGLLAVVFGVVVQLLFYGAALGINVPLATVALLVAAWLAGGRRSGVPWSDAWLPIAALVFGGFVALRGDVTLLLLDLLIVLTLTGASVVALGGITVVARPIHQVVLLASRFIGLVIVGGVRPFAALVRSLPRERLSRPPQRATPVLRGLLIALPIGLIFVALFSAADAVFARVVRDAFTFDLDLGDATGRVVVTLVAGWLAAGALAFAVPQPAMGSTTPDANPATPNADALPLPRLGVTEAVTVLVVVDLLFALFVALQAAYLFGGQDTLEASGLTYSEYARRGFLELIVVAALAGGLVLTLQAVVTHRSRLHVGAAIGLGLLTAVVLASALLRLRLYQEAYGWTELRFYALAAIAWMGIGLVLLIVALAASRARWLPHALIVSALVAGLAVNVIGPVRFVAEQNVARLLHPELVAPDGESGLDAFYLMMLGSDALPALIDALPALSDDQRDALRAELHFRADSLASDPARRAWQAWNLSRERARTLLADL